MILVVYSHICNFCLGDRMMAFNDIFFLFRLPCFFFISGWLFERKGRIWDNKTIKSTLQHKFMVLIVPTTIFLLLLAPPPLFFHKLGATKGGYWFTFTLFVFYILTVLTERYFRDKQLIPVLLITTTAFYYDVYYNHYFKDLEVLTVPLGFIGFMTWRYFIFFYMGVWVKKHWGDFISITEKPIVILATTIIFLICALLTPTKDANTTFLVFICSGISGIIIVFTSFRLSASFFEKPVFLSKALKYIGTRTMDIYLLHYFFLPRFLKKHYATIAELKCNMLDFTIIIIIAVAITALCLLCSHYLRKNHILAQYLFGAKRE